VSSEPIDEARRQQLEQRLAALDALRARHRRSQRRAPFWLIACVLCIPAAIVWGAAIAFYVMVVVISMLSLVFYVAWNHEQV
jgi:Flp pilus assembly protein TadB